MIKPETSDKMRYLMRLNAEKGSATKAEVKGYYVGGKTGTAEKVIDGRYAKNKVMAAFMAILPADAPKYLVLVMLDEPQGLPETHGFATSRLERRADHRQDHRPRRADAGPGKARRAAAGRGAAEGRAAHRRGAFC